MRTLWQIGCGVLRKRGGKADAKASWKDEVVTLSYGEDDDLVLEILRLK